MRDGKFRRRDCHKSNPSPPLFGMHMHQGCLEFEKKMSLFHHAILRMNDVGKKGGTHSYYVRG